MKKITLFLFFILSLQIGKSQLYIGTGGAVPDLTTVDFLLNIATLSPVTLNNAHGLVRVCLDINHTYVGDLTVVLISPSGSSTVLIGNIGAGNQNFTNTCLNDNASVSIGAGTAPYTGVFKPSDDLGNLNDGSIGNGTWILRVSDVAAADTGFLNNWSLEFDTGATTPFQLTSSNLPIIIINTFGQTIVDNPKVISNMKVIDNAAGIRNQISDLPKYDANIGIEIRGNYSASLPQKPYILSTLDISGNDSNVSLLGLPAEHDWILLATYNDKTFMRNHMIYDLFRQMGHYASRTKFCEVIINNRYLGIYVFCEKIKRDNNRVDIAKLDSNDNAGDSVTGGYILKHDFDEAGWNSGFTYDTCPSRNLFHNYYYPNATTITAAQADYIHYYIDSFEVSLFSNHFQDSTWGYSRFISQSSFIDYLLLNEFALNGDGYKKSVFYHKEKNGKLKAGPVWDFDWSLKMAPWVDSSCSGWYYKAPLCTDDVINLPWFNRLMEDTTFENAFYCRWKELRENLLLDTSTLFNTIDSTAIYLDEGQTRHFNKWRILGLDSGSPEIYPIPTSYNEELNRYKFFIDKRITWIDSNITGHCYLAPVDTSDTTGVSTTEYEDIQIQLYPNPTKNLVTIYSMNAFAIKEMFLFDVLGNEIKPIIIEKSKNNIVLNLEKLTTGTYVLMLQDQYGNSIRKKIIKD